MNKLSLNQLTQAHVDRLYNALYALADMVLQFGCETTFRRKKAVCDSGLSALESAFSALMFCGCKVSGRNTQCIKVQSTRKPDDFCSEGKKKEPD